ncbi:MAG: hypothetical protein DRO39_04825 [Thermoprotei archaeon]|nr:MAG: hypothetical protein DRO39_04825 [Thermoprotei archaeon]
MSRRALVLAIAAVVVIAAIGAYIYLQYYAQPATVKLVIVTRLSGEEARAIREAFLKSDIAKRFHITDVEFKKVDFGVWKDLAFSGKIDAFYVGEPAIYDLLCSQGAFRPIDLAELKSLVEGLSREFVGFDGKGRICWVGVGLGTYGYIVNREFVKKYGIPEPRSWADLLNPELGKPLELGVRPVSFPLPSKSGTARVTVMMILQKFGWDRGWVVLTALGALSNFVSSSEKARDDAAMGVAGIAPAYIGYGLYAEEVSKGKAVFIMPRGETVIYISPAAVARETRHPREAQAFILWLLSDDGQKAMAKLFGYLPVRSVAGLENLSARLREALENKFPYNVSAEKEVVAAVVTYFEAAIADPEAQELLTKVYRKALKLYRSGKLSKDEFRHLLEKLGQPLTIRDPLSGMLKRFTYDYARELTAELVKGKVSREELYSAVKKVAIERYASIYESLGSHG